MRSFAKAGALALLAAFNVGAAPAPRANAVSIDYWFCYSIGHGRLECDYTISGGTAPYSYAWNPTPTTGGGDGGFAIISCVAYRNKTVSMTVTDALGSSDSAGGTYYCGDAV